MVTNDNKNGYNYVFGLNRFVGKCSLTVTFPKIRECVTLGVVDTLYKGMDIFGGNPQPNCVNYYNNGAIYGIANKSIKGTPHYKGGDVIKFTLDTN